MAAVGTRVGLLLLLSVVLLASVWCEMSFGELAPGTAWKVSVSVSRQTSPHGGAIQRCRRARVVSLRVGRQH